jgi:hypothetical protein
MRNSHFPQDSQLSGQAELRTSTRAFARIAANPNNAANRNLGALSYSNWSDENDMQKREDVGLKILVEVASRAPLTGLFDDSCPDRNLVLVGKFIGLCQAVRIALSALYAETSPSGKITTKEGRETVESTKGGSNVEKFALEVFEKLPCENSMAVSQAKDIARLCVASRNKFAHGYWGREENATSARVFISFGGDFSDDETQRRKNRPEKLAEIDALAELNNDITVASNLLRWMNSHLQLAGCANSTISSSTGATRSTG